MPVAKTPAPGCPGLAAWSICLIRFCWRRRWRICSGYSDWWGHDESWLTAGGIIRHDTVISVAALAKTGSSQSLVRTRVALSPLAVVSRYEWLSVITIQLRRV